MGPNHIPPNQQLNPTNINQPNPTQPSPPQSQAIGSKRLIPSGPVKITRVPPCPWPPCPWPPKRLANMSAWSRDKNTGRETVFHTARLHVRGWEGMLRIFDHHRVSTSILVGKRMTGATLCKGCSLSSSPTMIAFRRAERIVSDTLRL